MNSQSELFKLEEAITALFERLRTTTKFIVVLILYNNIIYNKFYNNK